MVYTVFNAAGLGFDLVRTPGGPNAAEVIRCALTADAAQLQALANAHPGSCRRRCWDEVRASVHARTSTAQAPDQVPPFIDLSTGQASPQDQELLTRLGGSPLGNVDALDRFLRHDVLDWTWQDADDVAMQRMRDRRAADVLVDAVTSAYCLGLLDDDTRRHLVDPYLKATRSRPIPPGPPLGEGLVLADGRIFGDAAIDQVLQTVSTWTLDERREWRATVDLLRSQEAQRAAATHDAGWAAHLSGRVRTSACIQMRGVVAFRQAGFTAADAATGSWQAFSGVLQALTVADLLADTELSVLIQPWDLVRGQTG